MRRLPAALLCPLLLLLAGCTPQSYDSPTSSSQPAKPPSPAGTPFTITTYNINYGMVRPDLGVKAIHKTNADIVCLQETNPEWIAYLKTHLGDRYPHIISHDSPGAGGLAFLSRFPLEEVELIQPEAGWFPAWIVKTRTPAGPIQILNLHLHPKLSEQGSVSLGALALTPGTRRREVEQFHARLHPDVPTIILGDFNENESGPAFLFLTGKGFSDALGKFDTRTATWNWKTSYRVTLHDRFDHVLYSPSLRCQAASVIREGASDHLPVAATFSAN